MKYDRITEENIRMLVDRFYARIRQDPQLAPIFNNAIGETSAEWTAHLQRMYDFWSSIMLASRRYHGNPMKKHLDLPPFEERLFDRWLELFSTVANEIFNDGIADSFTGKSRNIARNFRRMMYPQPQ